MKTILEREATVPYSPKQMYDLVNNVAEYQQFLPWCSKSDILEQSETEMTATIEVAVAGFHKSFTTRNYLVPGQRIEMQHLSGPFKQLTGIWTFKPADQGSIIKLDMEFEVANNLKFALFGMLFNKAADRLVEAFIDQAKSVYE